MDKAYIVIISVLCGVVCLLFFLSLIFKTTQKKLEKYILNKFNKNDIIGATTRANFFGLKSLGSKQIRGNGAIVLTREKLYFIRATPFLEHIIPIEKIREISLPTSFNGKSVFKKLLCIHYQIDGQDEAIAWAIKSPEKWKLTIENIVKNS